MCKINDGFHTSVFFTSILRCFGFKFWYKTEFLIRRTPKYTISIPVPQWSVLAIFHDHEWFSVQFLHNRHLEPHWQMLISFSAHKWIPDAKEPPHLENRLPDPQYLIWKDLHSWNWVFDTLKPQIWNFMVKDLSWHVLHNRHVDPQWLILVNFRAHFWFPDIEWPLNF